MKFIRKSYLCFALVLLAHQSLCQQPSYSAAPGQAKYEDVDRDSPKQQSHVASAAPVPPQYVQYPTPDQFVYQLQPQPQSVPYAFQQAQGQQNAPPTPLVAAAVAPNQPQAVYTAAAAAGPQQPVIYVNQNGQPIDFSGIPLYPAAAAGYPPYVPTNGPAAGKTAPSAAKTVPTHVPNAFIIPNAAALQQYYQPVAFSQPANAQYYYNTLYQLQTPQKSVYTAGVKSTTPAIPVKGKDEQQFVGSNYFVTNTNPFEKLRATGRV